MSKMREKFEYVIEGLRLESKLCSERVSFFIDLLEFYFVETS